MEVWSLLVFSTVLGVTLDNVNFVNKDFPPIFAGLGWFTPAAQAINHVVVDWCGAEVVLSIFSCSKEMLASKL